ATGGHNTISGGSSDDTITLSANGAGSGSDVINLGEGSNTASDAGAGGDTVTGGNGGNNITTGASGSDSISTGNGNDTVHSGAGGDVISTGAGNDLIVFSGQGAITGGDGDDTIQGASATQSSLIDSGAGNDSISLSTGADTITGGAGNDTISGGGATAGGVNSHDVLTGGGGNDIFIVGAGTSLANTNNAEVITDWQVHDQLKIGTLGAAGGLFNGDTVTAANFGAAVTQADADLQTHANNYIAIKVGSDLVVFADTTADGHITSADDAVILQGRGLNDITAGDFI
ncbi:MAG: calcium-binding protein, partial [Proteobacteria bacterium]|nr:calcium-binding protein [Pseudomonadota bacterium]